jgi:hypothetical protein
MLSLPPVTDQMQIVELAELALQERHALHQLVQNRERQLQAIAENLHRAAQAAH